MSSDPAIPLDSPEIFISRELSWLTFASRVIALGEDPDQPLLERVKFTAIAGMLHDEFFMKRMSGLKRQIQKGSKKPSLDGRTPAEEFDACSLEIVFQMERLARLVREELRPDLRREGLPILDHEELDSDQRQAARTYFQESVQPILTPLAVDSEHPFPFVSNLGVNLAVLLPKHEGQARRFVRIKVPDNRPRWVPLPGGGWVPLEQVIAANLDLLSLSPDPDEIHVFRVTRGAEGKSSTPPTALGATLQQTTLQDDDAMPEPGSILGQVSRELKARRFAGVVRLQVDAEMPKKFRKWLSRQLEVDPPDLYTTDGLFRLRDLASLEVEGRDELRFPRYEPVTHPRLRHLGRSDPGAIFEEISRGDILVHHPYHSFDSSVLRLIESAAVDPTVLAIKLTIYRTSSDSPIVRALAEAARRGKQVAVLVEVTARFDEAPNIAWGQFLEKEGVHVAYGVEQLKTHVKLALVVREEGHQIRNYCHAGTGNYHEGTARLYEDVGVLTADRGICQDVAAVFNSLTGAMPHDSVNQLLVAPVTMRKRFVEMIRREVKHAAAGRACGIDAKMNQLQDPALIRELYRASCAGVPIRLNVRGLCCLKPGVPGLSENIQVFSIVGRFLEHSRLFRFQNDGDAEYYLGSADWMRRNLSHRVETIIPVLSERLRRDLDEIFDVYHEDNCSAWDSGPDGAYVRRSPGKGQERRAAQETFIRLAKSPPPKESSNGSGEDGPASEAAAAPSEEERPSRSSDPV